MDKHKIIMVYTDGACSNNPNGPGGWAATLNYKDKYTVLSGYDTCTTNNRMELTAVVEALKYLIAKGHTKIIINSDSAYVVNAINKGWIHDWKEKGWKTKAGKDVANDDLWKELYDMYLVKDVDIFFNKVAGHSGNTFNEIADEHAKMEVERAKLVLKQY